MRRPALCRRFSALRMSAATTAAVTAMGTSSQMGSHQHSHTTDHDATVARVAQKADSMALWNLVPGPSQ